MFLYFIALIAGAVNGMFASGGGIIALPMLSKALKDEKAAYSSVCVFILPLVILSLALLGKTPEKDALPVCAGAFFGGIAGAYLNGKTKLKYVKLLFGLIVIYSGVKMLL